MNIGQPFHVDDIDDIDALTARFEEEIVELQQAVGGPGRLPEIQH